LLAGDQFIIRILEEYLLVLNFNYIDSKKYHSTYHLYEDDALNFLKLGTSEEVVSQGTGLSVERIKELSKKVSK
jgi:hypothetical protein